MEYVKSLSAREKLMWQWHAGADNELMAGELGASSSRENLDFPWEFIMDMARLVWDEVRHTEIIEKRLEAMGGHMGCILSRLGPTPTGFLSITRSGRLPFTCGARRGVNSRCWRSRYFRRIPGWTQFQDVRLHPRR